MKINPTKHITEIAQQVEKGLSKSTQEITPEVKTVEQCAQNCTEAYGKALVNLQAKNSTSIVEQIFEGTDIHINRVHTLKDGSIRIQAGRQIKGFENLYDSSVKICQKYDINGHLKVFVKDEQAKTIDIYNESGELLTHYSKEDMDALFYYKYHPQDMHKYLRFGKTSCYGSFFEEMQQAISGLEKIFQTESQVQRIQKPTTLYRGMHIGFDEIGKAGEIFTDNSFTSTSTSLEVAKRFAGPNPVMELEVPPDTKYINIDDIFNIDRLHWSEKELLLENGSRVEILKVDRENNLIKARLL